MVNRTETIIEQLNQLFSGTSPDINDIINAAKADPTSIPNTEHLWDKLLTICFPDDGYAIQHNTTNQTNGTIIRSTNVYFIKDDSLKKLIFTVQFRDPTQSEEPVIDFVNGANEQGFVKEYVECAQAMGLEFAFFRCEIGEETDEPLVRGEIDIRIDGIGEDDDDGESDGRVNSFSKLLGRKMFEKVMLSIRESA